MSKNNPRILRTSTELTLSTIVAFDEHAMSQIHRGAKDNPDAAVAVCRMLTASFDADNAKFDINALEVVALELGLKLNI